jgi:isoaspartyl peptidase/L-asparaginase-like protein (Ntn-hydrolase superfamily)
MEPIVISTWKHGIAANVKAWDILTSGGNSLDAVEAGVRVAEDDPNVLSVGYGGLPDAEGTANDGCRNNGLAGKDRLCYVP